MGRLRTFFLTSLILLAGVTVVHAQVDTIAKRPYYELTASLAPTQHRATGSLLLRYVNQTGADLHQLVFAMDNPQQREDLISRVRVNRRSAEVTWFFKDQGAPFDGFELDAKRSMPPDVVSEVEISFQSQTAVDRDDLVLYQGDWFPRVVGPPDTTGVTVDRSLMDVDGTIDYPVEWRGALSGLILREDAIGDRVELFNAAAGIKHYGIVMGRNLRILEDELYGISVRTFTPSDDEDWGSRVLRQISEVVEYYKRRTPVTPPLILNVVPDGADKQHASVLFANTLTLPYRPGQHTADISLELGRALTELYWGFGGAAGPDVRISAMEQAFSHYGVLMWSRETNRDTSWVEQVDSRFHAGLLARHHPAIKEPVGDPMENGFAGEVGAANAFLTLRMLENSLPPGSFAELYDKAIVQYAHHGMDRDKLTDLLAEQGLSVDDSMLDAFDNGLPLMDARIVYTENRGQILDAWATEVRVQRTGADALLIPVGIVQTDGTLFIEVLQPGRDSVLLRSPLPPARTVIDPEQTLPLLSSAGVDAEAVGLVAVALAQEERWPELRDLIDHLDREGLPRTGEVANFWAEALLHTGYYTQARDLLHEAVQSGSGDDELGNNLLLLGKSYDLLGQRSQAIEAYRSAANHIGVSAEATHLIETPYTQAN